MAKYKWKKHRSYNKHSNLSSTNSDYLNLNQRYLANIIETDLTNGLENFIGQPNNGSTRHAMELEIRSRLESLLRRDVLSLYEIEHTPDSLRVRLNSNILTNNLILDINLRDFNG